MKGLFITFEGVECSGKSLQSKLLLEYCQQNDIPAILVREPGGTPTGEKLRSILLTDHCTGLTEFFILCASRTYLTETVILPKLEEGFVVISDRYFHSSLAYQGYGRDLDLDNLKTISTIATLALQPHKTFHLHLSQEVAESRLDTKHRDKNLDRIELEGKAFHNKIRLAYQDIATQYAYFSTINGENSVESIHQEIISQLKTFPQFNK